MKLILALSALVAITSALPLGTAAPTAPLSGATHSLSSRQNAKSALEAINEPIRRPAPTKLEIIPINPPRKDIFGSWIGNGIRLSQAAAKGHKREVEPLEDVLEVDTVVENAEIN